MFTTARHPSLFWSILIHFTTFRTISLEGILFYSAIHVWIIQIIYLSFKIRHFSLKNKYMNKMHAIWNKKSTDLKQGFIKKNPTRCNNVSKFYYSIFTWSSTCFGRHTAHQQKPKTSLAASGFSYVEGCWTCRWWTTSTSYTSNNLPSTINQRMTL